MFFHLHFSIHSFFCFSLVVTSTINGGSFSFVNNKETTIKEGAPPPPPPSSSGEPPELGSTREDQGCDHQNSPEPTRTHDSQLPPNWSELKNRRLPVNPNSPVESLLAWPGFF